MASKEVGLHEEAFAEAQAAYDWYATRNPAAAEGFIDELNDAIEQIGMFPEAGMSYLSGTRRYVLRRFPFTVIYRDGAGSIDNGRKGNHRLLVHFSHDVKWTIVHSAQPAKAARQLGEIS